MPNRSEIQAFLRANGFEAQANDQASLVFAERLVEMLGEVTVEMTISGGRMIGSRPMATRVYKAMWAARFRGE